MTQRLMRRFWCGAFPLFDLPILSEEELREERASISKRFFGSDAFATLRTMLRLKLQETPLITQFRSASAAHYCELIDLCEQYKNYVFALLRFINTPPPYGMECSFGATYTPLFFGFGNIDLRNERLVGKERRLAFAVPVDAVLVLVLLGQLHALHAETLVEKGIALQSATIVAASVSSWRSSTLHFVRAANIASVTTGRWGVGDRQAASTMKFMTMTSTQSIVLARLAQIHRAAACVDSLLLVDETVERLARQAAVCSRYAYTVATEAGEIATVLDDSALSQQLGWLLRSYEIRWRAIFYSYEQTIFQLDFNPEIAVYFGDLVLRGDRMPVVPPHSHKLDAYFTKLAQELIQAHATHQSESLEDKSTLIELCQRKLGPKWTFQQLPRELCDQIACVPNMGNLFNDEDGEEPSSLDWWMEDNEMLKVEAISTCLQKAMEESKLESLSLSAYSTKAVESEGSLADVKDHQPLGQSSRSTPVRTADLARPMSAGAAHCATRQFSLTGDWVTMRVGDRTLTFEPLPSPASTHFTRPSTAGATVDRRRNALPMVIDDASVAVKKPQHKIRPSSSPSYLSVSKKGHENGALTWVPTRAVCALCERRFTRQNLPGVVVMKRIFDLRRKWGMVLLDSKKFSAASALYGRANVCLMCQDILTFEDDKESLNNASGQVETVLDDIGVLIRNRIEHEFLQLPPSSDELLLDVAVDKRARQSSTNFGLNAINAVLAEPLRTAHTKEEFQPWWEVDLGNYYVIHSVKIWLREDTSHVFSFGGSHSNISHRKMAVDVPANAIPLSAVGVLQSGAGQGLSCGAIAPAPQPNVGLYPLHVCVSMKSGVERDFEDVIASSVSTHTVSERVVSPITWITPPNCRGRFVRVQSESVAFLHIEKVSVFVAQELPSHSAKLKREHARTQLKRVAFRASVISKKLAQDNSGSNVSSAQKILPSTLPDNTKSKHQKEQSGFASAFVDPEQAEKRRISRLYQKFKTLLDSRIEYEPHDRVAATVE